MSTPLTPPATPYCILTDRHLQKYFTRDRIQQHLRRAGLINKSGHILTEAEYENRLKNMEIGHTNQLKFEEALLEVIIELGEKQYESLCEEMENVKKQLLNQFGRIGKVDIEHVNDDQIPITTQIEPWAQPWNQPGIPERNRLDEILNKFDEFIDRMKTLAKINESNTFLLNLPETLRQLKENQNKICKQQYLWKKEYDERETQGTHGMKCELELLRQQIKASTKDKRHSEQEILTSAARKSLCDNSSHLHRSYSVESRQITLSAAIKASEKENMERENALEKLVRDAHEHVEKLEGRVNDGSSKTISRAEVEKLILDAIANLKPTENDDKRVLRKSIGDVNDKSAQLKRPFDQISHSTSGITNNHMENKESGNQTNRKLQTNSEQVLPTQAVLGEQQSRTPIDLSSNPPTQAHSILLIEQRLTQLETYLKVSIKNEMKPDDSIHKVCLIGTAAPTQPMIDPSNRQRSQSMKKSNQTTAASQPRNTEKTTLKNRKNTSLTPSVESGLHDNSVSSAPEGFKDYTDTTQRLRNQIDNFNQINPNRQAVDDRFKFVEQRKEQEITDLRKKINKYYDDLSKFSADLTSLHRQLTQKPISTPAPLTSNSLPMKKYTDEELQAIMPFIEPLPTFMMQMENEWDQFY
ncbi:unnamed protein product [Rotaria magnacalcarata]|uniref:Uncharacterized protein n=1 Tax=Rotaria magnacalcarata TaxID=392030 RepID=A0A816UXW8_9BILA|nr:unnamed protein product [Rotaria magnacalcarata]